MGELLWLVATWHVMSCQLALRHVTVYRTCGKFLEEAVRLTNPFDDSSGVDKHLKQNIFKLLTLGCNEVAKQRQDTFNYYTNPKAELSDAEAAIHVAFPPHRRQLVEDKAFLLFQRDVH